MKTLSFVKKEILATINNHPTKVLRVAVDQLEKAIIEEALVSCRGNQTKVAELLGINRGTLRKKMGLTHGSSK